MANKDIAYFRNIGYDARMVHPRPDAQLFRPRAALEPGFSGGGRMWKSAKRKGS
jgi:hypothetical protein